MAYITFQPSDYFNTTLWTGDGNSTQNITGTGFNADWIWLKGRSGAGDHQLYDKVRGVQKMLISNGTNAESTNSIGLQSFGSDGFTMGSDMTGSGSTFVSWNWKANGSGSANTDGSISSTVSANTTSGFSIVTYTGDGTSTGTGVVGHGLGTTPSMIMIKARAGTNAANSWWVYHSGLSANNNLSLNNTNAQFTTSSASSGIVNTSPTSTTFGFDSGTNLLNVNESGTTYVAYCFADKKGFSKFGSYTGNGNADGTFIYTGFRPAWLMIKRTNTTASWVIIDNQRSNPFNPQDRLLFPNTNASEDGVGETYNWDFLSNGIKARTTSGSFGNGSGDSYIYMAFAEHPLVSSNDIPGTAR
jgi:hypothetical protein